MSALPVAPDQPALLSVAEAAKLLGVSPSALHAAIKSGRCPVPVTILGDTRYIARPALDAHLTGTTDRIDALRDEVAALRSEMGQLTAMAVAAMTAALAVVEPTLPTSLVGGRERGTFQMEGYREESGISGRGGRLRVADATRRPAYGPRDAQPRAARARTAAVSAGGPAAAADGHLPGPAVAAGAGQREDRASSN